MVDRPELELAGVCTHLAVADEPANPYTVEQLARFDAVLAACRARGLPTGTVHAAFARVGFDADRASPKDTARVSAVSAPAIRRSGLFM